ncbi:MAG: hypothetical protein ACJ783_22110 [Myxococcales bacterium]
MRGTFRRDLTLATGEGASFRLRRRWGARVLSWALVAAAFFATALDLLARRPLVAAIQLTMGIVFLVVQIRAELDGWRFDGSNLVRRRFSLSALGFEELRLKARTIREVGVTTSGRRSRAWIETRSGEEYALVEGSTAEVERIADGIRRSVQLVAVEPPTKAVH